MNKITVGELLAQYGMTWYQLHKRGGGTKSMCWAWTIGKHLPSTRSAARIARALGLPAAYVLDTLRTRNQWENSPRVTWGTHVREALEASTRTVITDLNDSGEPLCPSCHQRISKAA
jgi:hypothetical protein